MEKEVKMENKNVEIKAIVRTENLFEVSISMRSANDARCEDIRMIDVMPNDIEVKNMRITMRFKDEKTFDNFIEKLCDFDIYAVREKENKYVFCRITK